MRSRIGGRPLLHAQLWQVEGNLQSMSCRSDGYQQYVATISGALGLFSTTVVCKTICIFFLLQSGGAFVAKNEICFGSVRNSAAAWVPLAPMSAIVTRWRNREVRPRPTLFVYQTGPGSDLRPQIQTSAHPLIPASIGCQTRQSECLAGRGSRQMRCCAHSAAHTACDGGPKA